MMRRLLLAVMIATGPATAGELRDLCPERPGRLTPACIVDPGHVLVEIGTADFTRDVSRDPSGRSTTTLLSLIDARVRAGLGERVEAFVEWIPYNRIRIRQSAGPRASGSGVGDITFGVKQSLAHPDGTGFSVAIQPFAVAPVNRDMIGNDGWVEGVVVPMTIELPDSFQLGFSPEVDRLKDGSGRGHHLEVSGAIGIARKIGAVTPSVELYVSRDDDPDGPATEATADFIAAWVPAAAPNLQLDAGAYVGLNHDTPGIELIVGVSRRF